MKRLPAPLLALTLAAPYACTWADDQDTALPTAPNCPATEAWTVFVSDATMRRHDGSASRITESHRKAEQLGWAFKDLEVYIENGDLQGFFITYTRPHPCNLKD